MADRNAADKSGSERSLAITVVACSVTPVRDPRLDPVLCGQNLVVVNALDFRGPPSALAVHHAFSVEVKLANNHLASSYLALAHVKRPKFPGLSNLRARQAQKDAR